MFLEPDQPQTELNLALSCCEWLVALRIATISPWFAFPSKTPVLCCTSLFAFGEGGFAAADGHAASLFILLLTLSGGDLSPTVANPQILSSSASIQAR